MAQYIMDNPQFIVNGFIRSGITSALDGIEDDDDVNESETESDSDDDVCTSSEDEYMY